MVELINIVGEGCNNDGFVVVFLIEGERDVELLMPGVGNNAGLHAN
jgi:hypothetical protein